MVAIKVQCEIFFLIIIFTKSLSDCDNETSLFLTICILLKIMIHPGKISEIGKYDEPSHLAMRLLDKT